MAVSQGVIPGTWDWAKLIAAAAPLLALPFSKADAIKKYGGEVSGGRVTVRILCCRAAVHQGGRYQEVWRRGESADKSVSAMPVLCCSAWGVEPGTYNFDTHKTQDTTHNTRRTTLIV